MRSVTWGWSGNEDSDWKLVSERAGAVVQRVNPDMLIIVSGLCYGFDLRYVCVCVRVILGMCVHACARS